MHRGVVALAPLYFVQGMPFGFQTRALKLHLTEQGVSLTALSLAGLLSLPWLLKPLIAPLVDRFGSRHAWILPLTGLLVATQLVASRIDPGGQLIPLLGLILAMNALTAAQDVAVDGLAVDILRGAELGTGNGVQVAGYKVGMLVGGSALVLWLPTWGHVFGAMAACTAVGLALHLAVARGLPLRRDASGTGGPSLRDIGRALAASVRTPAGALLVGFVLSYKVGESISDDLWKPFLQRGLGIPRQTLALWDTTWGTAFSIGGSALGGVLAARFGALPAVAWALGSRLIPAALCAVCTVAPFGHGGLLTITCFEELTGGALTAAMFALMMARVDHRIGATHFTVLAGLEVAGKAPGGLLAGALADAAGFTTAFGVAVCLSAAALLWVRPMARTLRSAGSAASEAQGL